MRNKVISLFSGCGGLDLGFKGGFKSLGKYYKKLNYEIIFSNDIDEKACLTYKKNFQKEIVCGDIRDLIDRLDIKKNVDVLLGGFPCQDFSHAGKRRGLNTERGTLYKTMCRLVGMYKPKVFIAENVKGLLTINDGEAIQKIRKDFENEGYNIEYKLFNVRDFGVPQNRERVIIVGTLKEELPSFDFSFIDIKKTNNNINLKSAIGDLENIREGGLSNHYWSKAKKNKGQGNKSVSMLDVSPTIRAEHHGNIEFHWNSTRRLSAREAARIQSFPDDFLFLPSTSSAYRQIGNAVPPIFAWNIALAVQEFIKANNINNIFDYGEKRNKRVV